MLKDPVFQFGVFYALLYQCAFGFVPSATNVSVVCHNFVNVLYWNYSNPADQMRFSVLVNSYESSDPRTINTSQMHLDISNYSNDATDDYIVDVTTYVGKEKSKPASIRFTYSKDYYDEKTHKYKCSLDFPAVNTSVRKDVIEVYFWHPSIFYEQDIPKEEFKYTVTYNQEMFTDSSCFEDEDLCVEEIYLNRSLAGQCVELKFEGKIAGIPTHTSRNVCVPLLMPHTDHTGLIMAMLGVGVVSLFVIAGVVWVLSKKWSKIPKFPEVLRSFIPGQTPTIPSQPECSVSSPTASDGHKPLLNEVSYPFSVDEKDCKTTTDLANTEADEPEVPEEDYDDDFTGFGQSSDYNSPKCLMEMSHEDFAEGYGPRPPILSS